MTKRRIFIAINLSDGVKNKLMEWQVKWMDLDRKYINWVRKENLHITLAFIGYATDDETYEICKIIRETAKNHSQFFIKLERIITGPASSAGKPPKTPRMFWVEGEESQELAELQSDLENALAGGNLMKKEARAFKPHITLARFTNQIAKSLPEINDVFKSSILVDSIDVMQSILRRTGPEYTILESINLEGNEN